MNNSDNFPNLGSSITATDHADWVALHDLVVGWGEKEEECGAVLFQCLAQQHNSLSRRQP